MHTKLSEIFSDIQFVYKLIITISSIGVIISGAEWLWKARQFKGNNLFSWKIRKTRISYFNKYKFFDFIYKYPNILFLIGTQVMCALLCLINLDNIVALSLLCSIIALISIILSLKSFIGHTGADQMLKATFIVISLCLLSRSNFAQNLGLIMISCHLTIAYATPGFIRLSVKEWRNGTDIILMIRSHTYGNYKLWMYLKNTKPAAMILSWGIIIFESFIVLAILLPTPLLVTYLVFGVIFHIGNAIFMGLNTFPWAFIATYPAFLWCSIQLKSFLTMSL